VRNSSAGVDIEVDGNPEALKEFCSAVSREKPPLAQIDEMSITEVKPNGFSGFEIIASDSEELGYQPISPDVSICPECLRELFDTASRYYRYPFVNCTNCGPRYSIIADIPYDRPNTTMEIFAMCPECAREYGDPANRRYHAQPVSCPQCGPRIWLEIGGQRIEDQEKALSMARQLVARGEVIAIKGLGGFQLACDANNPAAVARLRQRKARPDKPFALMLADATTVQKYCQVSTAETDALGSVQHPIVLLERAEDSTIADEVAPGQNTLGVMLPYTPLHHLLLEPTPGMPNAWVMTSGNRSGEPIITENAEAQQKLGHIATAFLMHDRPIQAPCDDSVVRIEAAAPLATQIRRARGYAPLPIALEWNSPPLLATGTELKNTFCLARDRYAFLSPHIGDMHNYETLQAYEVALAHYEHLFRLEPQAIAYDLHPDYSATRYGQQRAKLLGLPSIAVQHHHAHIAACMAENGAGAEQRVIGLAFDGTGFGTDGAIWGGEVLVADYRDFQRRFHLAYAPLPGGELAVRQPWRLALAWLRAAGMEWSPDIPALQAADRAALTILEHQLETRVNTPMTSSIGRLFDAVASLLGVRQVVHYEGQAAIELEALADPNERGAYAFAIGETSFDGAPVMRAALADWRAGISVPQIAARFHNGLAALALDLCQRIRQEQDLNEVALSGGVWQNRRLLETAQAGLSAAGFRVLTHHKVPANDGGVSLGQAAVAAHSLDL
jgi:hydrogenase maturation protein HypF